MKIIIFVLFFISTISNAKEIKVGDILQSFDLCSMKSSFGQRCKIDNPKKTFYEYMIDNKSSLHGANFNIEENVVTLESDDWFYRIEIISSKENKAILEFTDESKIGSYYAISELEIFYDEDFKKWIVIRDKTLSLSKNSN